MKKSFLAIIAVAAIFASCRKTRTCSCTSTTVSTATSGSLTFTDNSSGSSTVSADKYKKSTFKAVSNCNDRTDTEVYTTGSGNNMVTYTDVTDYSCELK